MNSLSACRMALLAASVCAALEAQAGETAGRREKRVEVKDGRIEVMAPEPLQDARCDLPPALRRVAGHALFRYLVAESGAVESVETLYASTSDDARREAFLASLEGCLKAWRYRPKTYGGKPVSERLLVAFHFLPAVEPDDTRVVEMPGGGTMPAAHLELLRQEKLKLAASLMSGDGYREIPGEGWLLKTDARKPDVDVVLEPMTFTTQAFETLFPGARPVPEEAMATILLFKAVEEFNEVSAFDNLVRMHMPIAGQYGPDERIVYTSVGDKPPVVAAAVLAHEVTHHLVHERLLASEKHVPFWLDEGLATFIECLRPRRDGRVDLASQNRAPVSKGNLIWVPHATTYLNALQHEAKVNKLASMAGYLDMKPGSKIDVTLAYAMSWLMVHYLVTSHEGAYLPALRAWLAQPGAERGSQGLSKALGRPFTDIEKELPQHLWQMSLPH